MYLCKEMLEVWPDCIYKYYYNTTISWVNSTPHQYSLEWLIYQSSQIHYSEIIYNRRWGPIEMIKISGIKIPIWGNCLECWIPLRWHHHQIWNVALSHTIQLPLKNNCLRDSFKIMKLYCIESVNIPSYFSEITVRVYCVSDTISSCL